MDIQHHRNTTKQRPAHALIVMVALMLLAVACASDPAETSTNEAAATAASTSTTTDPTQVPDVSTPAPDPTPLPEPTPAATTEPEPAGGDTTPAAEALDWVVTLLNNTDPDTDEVAARFSPEFLAIIPVEQIMGSLPQFWGGDWSIASSNIDEHQATAVLTAEGELGLNVDLGVTADEPHLIEGIRFSPAVDAPSVTTADEYEQALAELAPISQTALFEIIDDECSVALDLGAESVMPIGSIFKLWVLAELAQQVEAGQAAWDETILVQDAYKSSPDGTVFNLAEGTEVTLLELAEEMISISDNSATDHLMYHLGRENVEAAMVASGVVDPDRNIPMMTTSELFRIKFDPEPPNALDYRALDTAGRRLALDALQDLVWIESIDDLPLVNGDGVSIDDPRDHDIEWFATPLDLCNTHAYLADLATRPGLEPVADVLSINPTAGMDFDRSEWNDLRYKGGSEQGIVAVAWWMERADGRTFVLAGGVENPDAALNPAQAVAVLQQGANLAVDLD